MYKWRLLQEKKLLISSKGKKIMTNKHVKEFVMFYERLTKHMLKDLSRKSDFIIKIDKNHKLNSMLVK